MVLRLYYDAMSQPSRALLLFVRATKIPCQEVPVALRSGEHLQEKYASINRFKKVPAIDNDGFKLAESVAILRYLIRSNPSIPNHWYPKESEDMARVDEYMAWQHLNLRLNGSMVFQHKVIIPRMSGKPVNEKAVERYQKGLETTLEQLETLWLKDNPYVAGKDLTIADLLAVTELEQPEMAGYEVRKGRPILTAYMELVRSRLQPHYDEVHSIAHKIRDKARARTQ
jgi:glutathione S-transferase